MSNETLAEELLAFHTTFEIYPQIFGTMIGFIIVFCGNYFNLIE
jgi:hypothetical protein